MQLDGNKMYLVAAAVVVTGLVEAGLMVGEFDIAAFWNYALGGGALAAYRSALKKQERA